MLQNVMILGLIIREHQIKPRLENPLQIDMPALFKHIQVSEDKEGLKNCSGSKDTKDT